MGFLSVYSGVRTVPVGDPERGYWVQLREHISQGDTEAAERALSSGKLVSDPNGGASNFEIAPNVAKFRQLKMLASISDWNFDDDNGTVWPINLQNVRRIPSDEFDAIWKIIDEMNEPVSTEERRQFRDDGVSGDTDEQAGTALDGDVPG